MDVKSLIERAFPNDPIMVQVAMCESGMRQFDANGEVVRGIYHPPDTGLFQVNSAVWGKKAIELGYDIFTLEGNIKMAQYILKVQGLNAWVSHGCWLKHASKP